MKKVSLAIIYASTATMGCNAPTEEKDKNNLVAAKIAIEEPRRAEVHVQAQVDMKKEKALLETYCRKMEAPAQHIYAAGRVPTTAVGQQGTVIRVTPDDLVTADAQPVTDKIDIELRELTNAQAFAGNKAPTVSNGHLLVSGGAYYINMTSRGRQLQLKPGKTLKVSLPQAADKDMMLFYGKRDDKGLVNWQPANQKFVAPTATVGDTAHGMSEHYEHHIYDEVAIERFGWINCDRFIDNSDLTSVSFNFQSSDSITYAHAYLVFKNMNSLLAETYYHSSAGKFNNVPVNASVALIAVGVSHGKFYTSRTDMTIRANISITLKAKPAGNGDIHSLFAMQ